MLAVGRKCGNHTLAANVRGVRDMMTLLQITGLTANAVLALAFLVGAGFGVICTAFYVQYRRKRIDTRGDQE